MMHVIQDGKNSEKGCYGIKFSPCLSLKVTELAQETKPRVPAGVARLESLPAQRL